MVERLFSLLVYIVSFIISYCFFCAAKVEKGHIKKERFLYLALAILVLCLIAGLRADSVGVDVGVYITRDVKYGVSSQSFSQLQRLMSSDSEWLYTILVYFSTRFSTDIGILLFMLQLLCVAPCIKAFVLLKDRINVSLAFLIYLCYFYNTSLNLMRQSIACSFILLGVAYLYSDRKHKIIKMIISFIVSMLFHKAAILGILLLVMLKLLSGFKGRKFFRVVLFIGISILPALLMQSANYLINSSFLPYRYKFYLTVFVFHNGFEDYFVNSFSIYIIIDLIFRILLVMLPVYYAKRKMKNSNEIVMFENICISGLLIYSTFLIAMKTIYGNRISIFLDYFIMLLAPYVMREKGLTRRKFVFESVLVMSWLVLVMYFGSSGSQDYIFRFLN